LTPHAINNVAFCVTSEEEGIAMFEQIIVPITLAALDHTEDEK
jgi:hypothetical protein